MSQLGTKKMWVGAALLLGLNACKHDIETVTPEGPVVPPTAYNLTFPAHFPTPVAPPADNPLTVEGVALGRRLFYETALSVDNSVSCGSCHRQELAFSDGRAHAQGVNGGRTPRSSMSLANLAWEEKLTWDGAGASLEQQARTPIENPVEMHQPLTVGVARLQQLPGYPALFRSAFGSSTATEANTLRALAQFERTLVSSSSRFDQYRSGNRTALSAVEIGGLILFSNHPSPTSGLRGGNCGDCHSGNLQTNHTFSNNGLDATLTDLGLGSQTRQPTDNGKFRVPSLRNVALTAPYMHDGRFATLDDVLNHYNDHVARNSPNADPLILNASNNINGTSLALTATEKARIIAFLRTLTDSTFIRDPRFAKP